MPQREKRDGDDSEQSRPVAQTPADPRLIEAEVMLVQQKVKRERAATFQSMAMAALTGLSAVAVGWTLFQGRKDPQALHGTLVKPQ